MNKKTSSVRDVDALLANDSSVSQFPFEEFRMNLEVSIQQLEEGANRIRRWTRVCFAMFIGALIAMVLSGLFGEDGGHWGRLTIAGAGIAGMLSAIVLATIYQYRYQPAMAKAKDELLSSTILQIQQQLTEIQQKLSPPDSSPPDSE